ncbi:hypothetical protein BU15DRAFT_57903 [Melanogaster broomeanus]|nr:hypothetical protein BU15DRAFT_57903 [Melanogaster broomeanus]
MLPGMIPVALLGSAVYIGLQLVRGSLAHEKALDEAKDRIHALEEEVDRLQKERRLPGPWPHPDLALGGHGLDYHPFDNADEREVSFIQTQMGKIYRIYDTVVR